MLSEKDALSIIEDYKHDTLVENDDKASEDDSCNMHGDP